MGQICVTLPLKALAGGTAAPKAPAGGARPTAMGNRQCAFRPVRVPQNAAVNALDCTIRTVPQYSISAPYPWGRYASFPPPKALAGGTAAPPEALAGGTAANC